MSVQAEHGRQEEKRRIIFEITLKDLEEFDEYLAITLGIGA